MWDSPVISSFLFFILRPETSGARSVAPSSHPSVDLPPPATKPRFLARAPSPAPPPPSPTPSPASLRPKSLREWSLLELCSTFDPPLRSSSARTDPGNGFVVSYLYSPAFFPYRCAPPAPENGRRRRRACCRLSRGAKRYELRTVRLGGPDSPQVRLVVVERRCCLWWFRRIVLRTVRYWRADSPPYSLEFCPETLSSLVELAE